MSLTPSVQLALRWLAQSDVRHQDGIAAGGVNQGYNWQERSYPFVYSEITGYAVSMFACAYRWTNSTQYLDYAKEAAAFLIGVQVHDQQSALYGALPQGRSLPALEIMPQYYSFDVAMCIQGMLDLHFTQPDSQVEQSAQLMGHWLIERMQQENGAFRAMYDAENDTWEHMGDQFFDDFGCLHGKHAIGLVKLFEATGDERFASAARRVCDWVLTLQDNDGAFRASERQPQIISHPHCYTLEGLLYAHYVLRDERYFLAAQRGGEWLASHAQNRDGSINIAYKQDWVKMGRRITERFLPRKVTDATSQALRLWLLLYYQTHDERFLRAARRAGEWLRGMQSSDPTDPNALGGFYFWPGHPIMFTWATMFATHALYALDNVERPDGYRQLITELF